MVDPLLDVVDAVPDYPGWRRASGSAGSSTCSSSTCCSFRRPDIVRSRWSTGVGVGRLCAAHDNPILELASVRG